MSRHIENLFLAFVLLTVFFAGAVQAQNASQQIDELKIKLQTNPEDIGVRASLIHLLFMNGKYREVIDFSKKVMEELPDRFSFYYYTGESFRKLGNLDSAYIRLKQGYEKSHSFADLCYSYALVLLKLKENDKAISILQSAAKEMPKFTAGRLAAGVQAFNAGNIQTATEEFIAVFYTDKTKLNWEQNAFVEMYLFQSDIENKDVGEAEREFVNILNTRFEGKYDFDAIGEAFKCLIEQKRFTEAEELFGGLNKPKISQIILDKMFFSVSYGMRAPCPKLIQRTSVLFHQLAASKFGLPDTDLAPLFTLHDFMLAQGAAQLAADLTNMVMDTTSGIEEPYLHLAAILIEENKNEDAILAIREYFVKEKLDVLGYTDDFMQSFQSLLNQGTKKGAKSVLLKLNGLNIKDLNATYTTLGEIFIELGNGERAITILNKVLALDPDNHTASLKVGEAYYAAGHYDQLISSLVNTTDKEGLKFLALAYEKKAMLPEANKAWQRYLASTADTSQVTMASEHIMQNTIALLTPSEKQTKTEQAVTSTPSQDSARQSVPPPILKVVTPSVLDSPTVSVAAVSAATEIEAGVDSIIPHAMEQRRNAIALILAIPHYQSAAIPKVKYAKNDAEILRQYLIKALGFKPENILPRIADEQLTYGRIQTYVKSILPSYLKPDGSSDLFSLIHHPRIIFFTSSPSPQRPSVSACLLHRT